MQKKILFGFLLLCSLVFLLNGTTVPLSAQSQISKGTKTVEVYVTSWCGYCRKMLAFLDKNGIKYTAYDIEKDAAAQQKYSEYGVQGVPLVIVGQTVISGYDPDGVTQALK